MKFKIGALVVIPIAVLASALFIFQKIPKPNYINLGEPIICNKLPQFADYAVCSLLQPIVKPINFGSNSRALAMKNEILAATPSGINFAGNYMLVEGSCGVNCQKHAVLESGGDIVAYGMQTTLGVQFIPDSRLLVLNPGQKARYYEFKPDGFHYLCEVGTH